MASKGNTKIDLPFWERNGGIVAAASSAVFVLILIAFLALPQFQTWREAVGLNWIWTGDGFFRDRSLPEYQHDQVCEHRSREDAVNEEWKERRRTNGSTTIFSIP